MIDLTAESLDQFIQEGEKPVVVDFWAPWCGPCKALLPVVEELSASVDYAKFGKVNIDDNMDLVEKYGVKSVPTLLFFKDGQVETRISGMVPKAKIENQLKALL